MNRRKFSKKSMNSIDLICRSTDGAGADRYTAFEFFNLVHQHAFSRVLEPLEPTDKLLFAKWQSALTATGHVDFALGHEVDKLEQDGNGGGFVILQRSGEMTGKRIVLAMPPESMVQVLQKSSDDIANAFGPIHELATWSQNSAYQDYVSFTVRYNDYKIISFCTNSGISAWGVLCVALNKYMRYVDLDTNETIVLSCIITRLDEPSPMTGFTANQTHGRNELLQEAIRQLCVANPGLPNPSHALLSPGTYWNADEEPNHWDDLDTAFMLTPHSNYLSQCSKNNEWLWNIGCHNGYQKYHFTSMEAAVSNSAALLHKWFPHTDAKTRYPVIAPVELRSVIYFIWIFLLCIVVLFSIALFFRLHEYRGTQGAWHGVGRTTSRTLISRSA